MFIFVHLLLLFIHQCLCFRCRSMSKITLLLSDSGLLVYYVASYWKKECGILKQKAWLMNKVPLTDRVCGSYRRHLWGAFVSQSCWYFVAGIIFWFRTLVIFVLFVCIVCYLLQLRLCARVVVKFQLCHAFCMKLYMPAVASLCSHPSCQLLLEEPQAVIADHWNMFLHTENTWIIHLWNLCTGSAQTTFDTVNEILLTLRKWLTMHWE